MDIIIIIILLYLIYINDYICIEYKWKIHSFINIEGNKRVIINYLFNLKLNLYYLTVMYN